jgi:hypothetical protein
MPLQGGGNRKHKMSQSKHGASSPRTKTYTIWKSMRQCRNPKHVGYKYYGGRGIKVCQRWDDYAKFLADMGEAAIGLSIDRIDNDGDYEPGNCRWVERAAQSSNKRNGNLIGNPKMLTYCGESLTVRGWEIKLGLCQGAIWHRLKEGWTMEEALSVQKGQTK